MDSVDGYDAGYRFSCFALKSGQGAAAPQMVSAAVIFLSIAALTLAGFVAGRFFEKTRFPDVPILLGLGLLIGPVNRWAVDRGWGSADMAEALSQEHLLAVAPLIAGLALVVLLFDSGMELDFKAFNRSLGPAALHTAPILVVTILGVVAVGYWVFGMPLLIAGMLGVALVNVDQTVSAGILPRMRISEELRATYFVEMALYDLAAIPILVALVTAAGGGAAEGNLAQGFAALVAVSIAMGIFVGITWIYALRRLQGHPHSYMFTFAVTLACYGATEFLGGSGALSILLFGLFVGNRTWILKRFGRIRDVDLEHEKVQAFHDEITFFVRTLYFLFLGASVAGGLTAAWPSESPIPFVASQAPAAVFAAASIVIIAVVVLARFIPIWIASARDPERMDLFPVFGRGLDTAVLATLPFIAAGYVPGSAYHDTMSPWQPVFINLAFLAILATVFMSSILVWLRERRITFEEVAKAERSAARRH